MSGSDQDFVEAGLKKVKAELDKLAFRVTPSFADIEAAVRGVLDHVAEWFGVLPQDPPAPPPPPDPVPDPAPDDPPEGGK